MNAFTARAAANVTSAEVDNNAASLHSRLWSAMRPTAPRAAPTSDAPPAAEPDWDGLHAAAEAEVERKAVQVEAPDAEARIENIADVLRRHVVATGRRIAATKKALRAAQAEYEAECLALERRWAAAMAEGEAQIEADERLAAKCRAFLGE